MASGSRRNIYIIGAPSTGKTTLVHGLKQHFDKQEQLPDSDGMNLAIIVEVARKVFQERGFHRDDITTSPEKSLRIQDAILQAQYEAEKRAAEAADWYISDRSGLDPIAFAKWSAGDAAAQHMLTSPSWSELEQKMKDGTVLLCESGVTWLVDDGVRLMPKDGQDWDELELVFRKLLSDLTISYNVVPKSMLSLDDRIRLVVDLHRQG